MESPEKQSDNLYHQVASLVELARKTVIRQTNSTMVTTYYLIGKQIVEYEQEGDKRAKYAKETLKNLSFRLKTAFGKGFSEDNLSNMRKFFLTYSISEIDSRKLQVTENQHINIEKFKLGWSHYVLLCRIKNVEERSFYEIESFNNNWGIDELKRQFDTALYERLVLSKDKEKILALSKEGQIIEQPKDIIKNPLILEFLGLEEKPEYSENDLETAIINQIEKFMLELGKGFFYGGRQVRFTFDEQHFFVDLIFYNRILKCFVLIDLKIGTLKHQDLGQMQMYVNYYDRYVKDESENSTIGIIVCKDKNDTIVEITLPKDNNQIFASQYKLCLPSKEELRSLIENNA